MSPVNPVAKNGSGANAWLDGTAVCASPKGRPVFPRASAQSWRPRASALSSGGAARSVAPP
eukprot:14821697-Alexandrium_andersonii.AAC.1